MITARLFLSLSLSLLAICVGTSVATAKVGLPNYNFTYDSFAPYLPGANYANLEKANGAGEIVSREGKNTLRRYLIKHQLYVFPIWILADEEMVLSMYTRLPSYFLHDVFHQSLINRYGKQDQYFKREEHAVYKWKDASGFKITYEGACTITCFPIYLSVDFAAPPAGRKVPKTVLDYFKP